MGERRRRASMRNAVHGVIATRVAVDSLFYTEPQLGMISRALHYVDLRNHILLLGHKTRTIVYNHVFRVGELFIIMGLELTCNLFYVKQETFSQTIRFHGLSFAVASWYIVENSVSWRTLRRVAGWFVNIPSIFNLRNRRMVDALSTVKTYTLST